MGTTCYICCVQLHAQNMFVLWCSNDFDYVYVSDDGKIDAFRTAQELELYAQRLELALDREETAPLNLDCVRNWLEAPSADTVEPVSFLNAWNFFTDVRSGVNRRDMDVEDKDHLTVYNKLFFANNLPAISKPGNVYVPAWSTREIQELRDILSAELRNFTSLLRFAPSFDEDLGTNA